MKDEYLSFPSEIWTMVPKNKKPACYQWALQTPKDTTNINVKGKRGKGEEKGATGARWWHIYILHYTLVAPLPLQKPAYTQISDLPSFEDQVPKGTSFSPNTNTTIVLLNYNDSIAKQRYNNLNRATSHGDLILGGGGRRSNLIDRKIQIYSIQFTSNQCWIVSFYFIIYIIFHFSFFILSSNFKLLNSQFNTWVHSAKQLHLYNQSIKHGLIFDPYFQISYYLSKCRFNFQF